MNFFASLFGKRKKMVTVPPGHRVVVIHPAPAANLGCCESGVWIAELGANCDFSAVVSSVAELASTGRQAYVIWIIQTSVLNSARNFDSLIGSLAEIVQSSRGIISHSAFVPRSTGRDTVQVRQLIRAGVHVYEWAEDGSCFVEVHKPDGTIVIGMAGRNISD